MVHAVGPAAPGTNPPPAASRATTTSAKPITFHRTAPSRAEEESCWEMEVLDEGPNPLRASEADEFAPDSDDGAVAEGQSSTAPPNATQDDAPLTAPPRAPAAHREEGQAGQRALRLRKRGSSSYGR